MREQCVGDQARREGALRGRSYTRDDVIYVITIVTQCCVSILLLHKILKVNANRQIRQELLGLVVPSRRIFLSVTPSLQSLTLLWSGLVSENWK